MAISDYKVLDDSPVGIGAVSDTQSSRQFPIGLKVKAVHSNGQVAEFMYAQGSNVVSEGQLAQFVNGQAVLLASGNSSNPYLVGVAGAALTGTSRYGWVQIGGYCDYLRGTNSAIAAGRALYLGATDGQPSSAVGIGSKIQGAIVQVAYASDQAGSRVTAWLDYPMRVHGLTASQ